MVQMKTTGSDNEKKGTAPWPGDRAFGRYRVLLTSMVLALVWIVLSFAIPEDSQVGIVFFDRKATVLVYPFTIQNLMWFLFFVGTGELYHRNSFVRRTRQALQQGYLSDDPRIFYTNDDLIDVRKKTHDKTDILAQLINILTIRYQAGQKSVEETHQMLNSQLELLQFKIDVDYNMIRYITWLIPTLGFIGTVMGIAVTLSAAGEPGAAMRPEFLPDLTSRLAVAFNTTLVSLIMSAVLVLGTHLVQGAEEKCIHRSGTYCLNNLINKLISK
jgi:biopolymer transport protein ExbB/TolQ